MFLKSFEPSLSHIAVLGNALPRRCGIATYTTHSVEALRTAYPELRVDHYAMDDGHVAGYGKDVFHTVATQELEAYQSCAAKINLSGAQLLWVHHEFGIFGGTAGDYLVTLLSCVQVPIVVTLHTVLANPNDDQRRVMDFLIGASTRIIVMARAAAHVLARSYGVNRDRIHVIPHGAPDRPFAFTRPWKRKLGLAEAPTVLTFGLLSPGKGVETAIRAIPSVTQIYPNLQYLVVGATHPELIRTEGERYRESLSALVHDLHVDHQVKFIDRFLDNDDLLDYLQAADIYLTPYLGREQVTSGTLSYALAMGKPVVSTPYIHAEETLSHGLGTLVPFGDAHAISNALIELLRDPDLLLQKSRLIWEHFRMTIWRENAKAVMAVVGRAVDELFQEDFGLKQMSRSRA
jgi:glycosyltransferase involved in cell wall biosynthesis